MPTVNSSASKSRRRRRARPPTNATSVSIGAIRRAVRSKRCRFGRMRDAVTRVRSPSGVFSAISGRGAVRASSHAQRIDGRRRVVENVMALRDGWGSRIQRFNRAHSTIPVDRAPHQRDHLRKVAGEQRTSGGDRYAARLRCGSPGNTYSTPLTRNCSSTGTQAARNHEMALAPHLPVGAPVERPVLTGTASGSPLAPLR